MFGIERTRGSKIALALIVIVCVWIAGDWVAFVSQGGCPGRALSFQPMDCSVIGVGRALVSEHPEPGVLPPGHARKLSYALVGAFEATARVSPSTSLLFVVALHVCNALLLFGLALRLGWRRTNAAVAGLLFLMPGYAVRFAALEYIVEFLLLGAYLLVLVGYLGRRLSSTTVGRMAWGFVEIAGIAVGLFGKESFPVYLALLLVLELGFLRRRLKDRGHWLRPVPVVIFGLHASLAVALFIGGLDSSAVAGDSHHVLESSWLAICGNVWSTAVRPILWSGTGAVVVAVLLLLLVLRGESRSLGLSFALMALAAALPASLFAERELLTYAYQPWAFAALALASACEGGRRRRSRWLPFVVALLLAAWIGSVPSDAGFDTSCDGPSVCLEEVVE